MAAVRANHPVSPRILKETLNKSAWTIGFVRIEQYVIEITASQAKIMAEIRLIMPQFFVFTPKRV